jgi:hypothetical protein
MFSAALQKLYELTLIRRWTCDFTASNHESIIMVSIGPCGDTNVSDKYIGNGMLGSTSFHHCLDQDFCRFKESEELQIRYTMSKRKGYEEEAPISIAQS